MGIMCTLGEVNSKKHLQISKHSQWAHTGRKMLRVIENLRKWLDKGDNVEIRKMLQREKLLQTLIREESLLLWKTQALCALGCLLPRSCVSLRGFRPCEGAVLCLPYCEHIRKPAGPWGRVLAGVLTSRLLILTKCWERGGESCMLGASNCVQGYVRWMQGPGASQSHLPTFFIWW